VDEIARHSRDLDKQFRARLLGPCRSTLRACRCCAQLQPQRVDAPVALQVGLLRDGELDLLVLDAGTASGLRSKVTNTVRPEVGAGHATAVTRPPPSPGLSGHLQTGPGGGSAPPGAAAVAALPPKIRRCTRRRGRSGEHAGPAPGPRVVIGGQRGSRGAAVRAAGPRLPPRPGGGRRRGRVVRRTKRRRDVGLCAVGAMPAGGGGHSDEQTWWLR
jgi:hypothetical protein